MRKDLLLTAPAFGDLYNTGMHLRPLVNTVPEQVASRIADLTQSCCASRGFQSGLKSNLRLIPGIVTTPAGVAAQLSSPGNAGALPVLQLKKSGSGTAQLRIILALKLSHQMRGSWPFPESLL